MSEYTFSFTACDGTVVTLEGNKETIDDILEDFKDFLKGCTFSPEVVNQIGREENSGSYKAVYDDI